MLRLANTRIRITDPTHPHFGEHGRLTGLQFMMGNRQASEVKLESKAHGEGLCVVFMGQYAMVWEESKWEIVDGAIMAQPPAGH